MNAYVVMRNQQIGVEAETADEALQKVLKGEGTVTGGSWNVQLRPPPQNRGAGATQIPA